MAQGRWTQKVRVESMSSDKKYTLAMDAKGDLGCSCPAWKFQKGPRCACKHIRKAQDEGLRKLDWIKC